MSDPRYPGGPHPQPGYRPDVEETTQLPRFSYEPQPPYGRPERDGGLGRSPALGWGLRILGLVLVAVVSGLVWYYITHDGSTGGSGQSAQPSDQPTKVGKYGFTVAKQLPQPVRDNTCVDHASGKVQRFLTEHRCTELVRGLYTATGPDGRTVYASVSVVQMGNGDDAHALKELTQADNTGNVKDAVRDGLAKVAGLTRLDMHGGYASEQIATKVIIVEADFTTGAKAADEAILDDMCNDALRFGTSLN